MTRGLRDSLSPLTFFFVKNKIGLHFGWERVSIGEGGMAACNLCQV